jgi:phosphoribosyl 1,2-cyclic phosphodiesterase
MYAADVLNAGIVVYTSAGTMEKLDIGWRNSVQVKAKQSIMVGEFQVMPFGVKHDAAEPLGFLINHPETGNVLFLTDTLYAPFRFRNLNQVIIEANFCERIIDRRMREEGNKFHRDRVVQSHMSIETCKQVLAANDLSQVNNIVLIHLSDRNSHEDRFRTEVQQLTGKTVHVASKGMTIENFNLTPF